MVVEFDDYSKIMALIPQKPPFRFIDGIISIDEKRICSFYTFKEDEFFYRGHFPLNPITPGVILIETMAQSGVVAHALFQMMKKGVSGEALKRVISLFTLADDISFHHRVLPKEKVLISGEKIFFRNNTMRSRVSIHLPDGTLVCQGTLTGAGIES